MVVFPIFCKRLLIGGEDTDVGKTITFFVDGISAGIAVYTSGTATSLDLAVTKGGTTSGGTSPGLVTTPAPAIGYTRSATLQTDTAGTVQSAVVISVAEGDTSLTIGQGVQALDHSRAPLGAVSVESIPPADLPGTPEPVGRAVRCGPDGAPFDPAIRISFVLAPEEWERSGAGQFVVRWYNSVSDAWESLPTTVHPETRTITATVSHFTLVAVFTVLAEEAPTATAPLTDPTLTFGPVASATAVQRARSSFPWLAGLVALAGMILLVRKG